MPNIRESVAFFSHIRYYYHMRSISRKARQLADAADMGYEPCKRCY